MPNVRKQEIINYVSKATGVDKVETSTVIEAFLRTIIETLATGNDIEIRGFGSFRVKKKNGRMARNPKTGEEVYIETRYAPTFKFSRDFRDYVIEKMKAAELKSNQKLTENE